MLMHASRKRVNTPVVVGPIAVLSLILSLKGDLAHAALEQVLFSEDSATASQWVLEAEPVPKGNQPMALLAQAKYAEIQGDGEICLEKLTGATNRKQKSALRDIELIHPWVSVQEMRCFQKIKATGAALERFVEAGWKTASRVEKEKNNEGRWSEPMRDELTKLYLFVIEKDAKKNRARAARAVARAEELAVAADDAVKAKVWRVLGDYCYGIGDLLHAREYFARLQAIEDTPESRSRLAAIESSLRAKEGPSMTADKDAAVAVAESSRSQDSAQEKSKEKTADGAKKNPAPQAEASADEIALAERVTQALKDGDLVGAVEDAVRLTKQFGGGTRAKWASDRVLDAYWTLSEKNDSNLARSRAELVKKMSAADVDRLADWAKSMYARGAWDDAVTLLERALQSPAMRGVRAAPLLEMQSKAALASDKFEVCKKALQQLIVEHAGTAAAREALFRSALLNYRLKDYSSAQAEFERLLAQSQIGLLELPARYWLWRSLQTQNVEGAKEQQEELIRKFPFSYYGLRARIEANGGFVEWKIEKAKEKLSSKVWLSEGERLTWKRAQALLKAGWLEEAQKELADLPAVSKSGDKAIRALLWAAAGQFTTSSRLANEAWDEAPELRVTALVQAAYPQVFPDLVQAQAAKRKLDPMLVRSLIKQESGFNPRALSSSNAMGLMQLMMPTAREMAQELKLGAMAKAEDVQVPARNVQMGSLYLSRLLNKYSGSVPLALAGYNAGPARIDRWMKLRASLKGIAERRSSHPDDEIWFDELPYQETSVYVKAILRNLIIYKMLDQGRVQVSEPIWSNGAERESAGPVHVAPPGRRRLACFERLSQNTTRQSQVCQ